MFTIETLLFRCYHNASSTPMVINIIFFLKHCRQHFHVIWSYFPNWRLLRKNLPFVHIKHVSQCCAHLWFLLKGVTGNVWFLNWDCSIIETYFRIHLRPIRRFYGAYLFRKSANSIFKILNYCPFWRDDFVNLLGMHAPDDQFAVVRLVRVFIINKDWRIMF